MTEMEYQISNWYYFSWLCGDHICEQHIHNLDVFNWVKDAHPVEANGMGGCQVLHRRIKGTGQIFDHHFVEYTYKDGTKLYSQCRHMPNTWGKEGQNVYGTEGHASVPGNIGGSARGQRRRSLFGDSMVQEHHDLITAIKNNEKYHEGWHARRAA